MALSGVKNPGDLCILLPDDMDDFTIGLAVDVDVVQILETIQSSRPHQSPRFRLAITPSLVDAADASLFPLYRAFDIEPDSISVANRSRNA
jgi:hypothetical protein